MGVSWGVLGVSRGVPGLSLTSPPAVAKRKSLFDDKSVEIEELTYIIKQVRGGMGGALWGGSGPVLGTP